MNNTIGVLALQGAYQKHVESLSRLGVESRLIRKAAELESCTGLIIPGGESTTMSLLIQESGMFQPLQSFAHTRPVMGVCAGMILMAESVDDERVTPLQILPFRALRNHYGRQVHSFTANIQLGFDADGSGSASWGVTDSERVNPWFDGVEYGQENGLTWRDVVSANCP